MNKKTLQNGFTLIVLIIVMVILGIMAAIAVPRYIDSIDNAEASAEDAVISAVEAGLKQYANNQLVEGGRATWPDNPFDALAEKPAGHTADVNNADVDGEWTFNTTTSQLTHQRADNSRYTWDYDEGTQVGDAAAVGALGERVLVNPAP